MADIQERLDGLRIHIQEPEFLEGKGLSCTKLQPSNYISEMLSPTLGVSPEDVLNIPIPHQDDLRVLNIVDANLNVSKLDWDSFETSWDFQCHPLIELKLVPGTVRT